jgi:hypothetical protein
MKIVFLPRMIFLLIGTLVFPYLLKASELDEARRLWSQAVEKRSAGEKIAPSIMRYTQYELDSGGGEKSRENGAMSITYSEDGVAALTVVFAEKNNEDFTEERKKRLARSAERSSEFRRDRTPFDSDSQDALKLGETKRVSSDGLTLWEYRFELPLGKYTMTGTARVRESDGSPHSVGFSFAPLPIFVDLMEMDLRFRRHGDYAYVPEGGDYRYSGSFLFFKRRGGGSIVFDDWTELSVKPRLGG